MAVVQCLRHSAEPVAAPPTSPFMALLIDPLAVRAQALFPRCSSVCGCTNYFLWFVVLCAAVPEFFQRDREFLPPPTAVVAVSMLRLCQTLRNFRWQ